MSVPAFADSRQPFGEATFEAGRSPLSPLRATLALCWLAAKRNGGLLLLPAVAGVMWWLVRDSQQIRGFVLWMPTVQGIGYTLVIAGPLTAALASWVAGRSRRRGMTDLLATTPLPSGWSVVAEWLGITFWALATYLASAAVALAWTAWETTWGEPLLWPILIAAVALAVCSAGGLLLGHLWPSRFLPPILAIAVAFLIVGPTGMWQLDRFKMLSPMGPIDSVVRDPLVLVDLRVMLPHLRWLVALGLALVLALVVYQRPGWLSRALLLLSAVATVVTASPLLDFRSEEWGEFRHGPIPYEPICATGAVTVCVHPAYERLLDETATAVEIMVLPLAGVPGVPTRYEQSVMGMRSGSAVGFDIWDTDFLAWDLGREIPQAIVSDWEAMNRRADEHGFSSRITAAQGIVAAWLTQEYQLAAGLVSEPFAFKASMGSDFSLVPVDMVVEGDRFLHCTPDPPNPQSFSCRYDEASAAALQPGIDAATERFLALDPAARRAWLEANWTELRAGLLTLEDMP